MEEKEDSQSYENIGPEEQPHRQQPNTDGLDPGRTKQHLYLGCLTKQQLIRISVAVGLVLLLVIISAIAVAIAEKSGSTAPRPTFSTGGDMLDFLVQSGDISEPDGLLATWFHRANGKEEMNKALASDVMILEADVTLEGYGTPNVKPIPIMAHPPAVHSDNTLDQWLDAVLASRKGMKLDFKALESVGLSLDLLSQKNSSRGINRPVWLNADIFHGPNIPPILPPVNGTRFLELIQEKFPDVTLSPGWQAVYIPPLLTATYTRRMMEKMFDLIKDVPQKVTFPVHALLVRRGWHHISWLLSRSPRFSLTLWQGSIHPNVSDLLFVRDNTHPARVYYDIYEPTLSQFKQLARRQGRLRRFYPGGDLMDFLHPTRHTSTVAQHDSLKVRWLTVTDGASLVARLSDVAGGMLVVQVGSDGAGVPLVGGSGKNSELLTLQDVLLLLGQKPDMPWGIYLRVQTQQLLEISLQLLHSAYSRGDLYRPVWLSVEDLHSGNNTNFHRLVSAVDNLFPYVTVVLTRQSWPPVFPAAARALSQRTALHLDAAALPEAEDELRSLTGMADGCDVIVEEDMSDGPRAWSRLKALRTRREGRADRSLYVMSVQS